MDNKKYQPNSSSEKELIITEGESAKASLKPKKKKRTFKRIIRKIKRNVLIPLMRFFMHYCIPFILFILPLAAAVFITINYFYNGYRFSTRNVILLIIPVTAVVEIGMIFLSYLWLKFLKRHDVIR